MLKIIRKKRDILKDQYLILVSKVTLFLKENVVSYLSLSLPKIFPLKKRVCGRNSSKRDLLQRREILC